MDFAQSSDESNDSKSAVIQSSDESSSKVISDRDIPSGNETSGSETSSATSDIHCDTNVVHITQKKIWWTAFLRQPFAANHVTGNLQFLPLCRVMDGVRASVSSDASARSCCPSGSGPLVANRLWCLEAGISNFAVVADIRARRASMLAGAAKRICSSVSFARATLGTKFWRHCSKREGTCTFLSERKCE